MWFLRVRHRISNAAYYPVLEWITRPLVLALLMSTITLFRRYQLFPEMEEMVIGKVRQRTFLYDTNSPDYRDHHMRANAWEGIGKELKIKRKFYVSSRDVRIVCPRLKCFMTQHGTTCHCI
jgi:hypothetical protein